MSAVSHSIASHTRGTREFSEYAALSQAIGKAERKHKQTTRALIEEACSKQGSAGNERIAHAHTSARFLILQPLSARTESTPAAAAAAAGSSSAHARPNLQL